MYWIDRHKMMSGRRFALTPLALLAVAALAAGCTGGSGGGGGNVGVARVASEAAGPFTRNFNPLLISSHTASGYSNLVVYEPLQVPNFDTGRDDPWLAMSMTFSNDGKTLTIELRNGVKWSDGAPFSSDDVAFTFNLLKQYSALNANGIPIVSATATSTYVTTVGFSRPAYTYPFTFLYIVPEHIWKNVADPVTFADPNPVGTGPYMLKTFTPQVITYVSNPNYWGSPGPKLAKLQYLAFDSTTSMVTSIAAGTLDWATASVQDPKAIVNHDTKNIHYFNGPPSNSVVLLWPNVTIYPLNLTVVRKAISLALDRSSITKIGMHGFNEPVTSPTGLRLPALKAYVAPQYQSLRYPAGNPAAAKSMLVDSGFKLSGDGVLVTPQGKPFELRLTVPMASDFGDFVGAAQVISSELGQAGIRVTVLTEAPQAWRDDQALGQFQLTLRANGGTVNPFDFYNYALNYSLSAAIGKKATRDFGRYNDPAVQSALEAWAASAPGSPQLRAAEAAIQGAMVDDVPIIPLAFSGSMAFWRTDNVVGFPTSSDNYTRQPFGNSDSGARLVLAHLRSAGGGNSGSRS
jgi:peptide/nickel transport system substrate-binding protein